VLYLTRQKTEEAFNKETAKGIKLSEDKLALEKRLGIEYNRLGFWGDSFA